MTSTNASRVTGTLTLAALFAAGSLNAAHAVTLYSSGVQGLLGTPGASTTVSAISGISGGPNFNQGLGDDYKTTASSPTITLSSLSFYGGVSVAKGVLGFEFYTPAGVDTLQGFAAQFSSNSAGLYTITLNTPIVVPSAGYLMFQAVRAGIFAGVPGSTATLGIANGVDVGSNDPTITAMTDDNDVLTTGAFITSGGVPVNPQTLTFEINGTANVPEPGAVTLLMGFGASGAVLLGRRKAARK